MIERSILPIRSLHDEAVNALLAHLARYRLSDIPALRQVPRLNPIGAVRLHGLLRDCRRRQLVESALYQGVRYWFLQPDGAERGGLTARQSGSLSEPAKLRAYAILRYCCSSNRPRHLLTADELKRYFPTTYRPGLPNGYYFDAAGDGTLGLLRVDGVGQGRWDRALQSLRHDIRSHALHDGFRQLVVAGRFQITLVTPLPQKAARLRDALTTFPDARRAPVEIVAMPELLPLVIPCRRKEKYAAQVR